MLCSCTPGWEQEELPGSSVSTCCTLLPQYRAFGGQGGSLTLAHWQLLAVCSGFSITFEVPAAEPSWVAQGVVLGQG